MPTVVQRRDDKDFCGSEIAISLDEWFPKKSRGCKPLEERWQMPQSNSSLCVLLDYDKADEAVTYAADIADTQGRFLRLADEWSRNTRYVSSASDLINDRAYQEIINLGWDVVQYLLIDLQRNKRFWFPALAAITGIRPFDKGDANNPRRMTEAWIRWGKWKGFI